MKKIDWSAEEAYNNSLYSSSINFTDGAITAEIYNTSYQGNTVAAQNDQYGDWICVHNYEHYGGTNPTVSPGSTFPQMPNGLSNDNDVNNLGSNGELRHVDNITQYSISNVDAVRLEGYTENHNRKLHYFTTNQTVIDAIIDNSTSAGHSSLADSITKYSDHDTYLPDIADKNQTDSNSNQIFGYGFPMYGDGGGGSNNEHWALGGNGDRWEMDDRANNASQTTVHRIWVRITGGL